jgi:hypothetical protein
LRPFPVDDAAYFTLERAKDAYRAAVDSARERVVLRI